MVGALNPTNNTCPPRSLVFVVLHKQQMNRGNGMGNPGVFQGNLCSFPLKPAPAQMGVGFVGMGHMSEFYRCDQM